MSNSHEREQSRDLWDEETEEKDEVVLCGLLKNDISIRESAESVALDASEKGGEDFSKLGGSLQLAHQPIGILRKNHKSMNRVRGREEARRATTVEGVVEDLEDVEGIGEGLEGSRVGWDGEKRGEDGGVLGGDGIREAGEVVGDASVGLTHAQVRHDLNYLCLRPLLSPRERWRLRWCRWDCCFDWGCSRRERERERLIELWQLL